MNRYGLKSRSIAAPLLAMALCGTTCAAEPNETFPTATVLSAGVLSVSDQLTVEYSYPDTFLGILSDLGEIGLTDDDSSIYGDGFASGLSDLTIESDSISFAVTGFGDADFTGAHTQSGEYEVFVDVYGVSGQPIDAFSEIRTLQAGVVDEFSFSDGAWIDGSFDVNIDNSTLANDIDFFTFTGLSPGATFAARTLDTNASNVDTFLGWFSDVGTLLESDDDDGGGLLSLIEGVVPTSGELTFAVTGFGDSEFGGFHSQVGGYELSVTHSVNAVPGDYNGNGIVDAADYPVWRDHLGQAFELPNEDPDNLDGMVTQDDYDFWKLHFGQIAAGGAQMAAGSGSAIPEPSTVLLVVLCGVIMWARSR